MISWHSWCHIYIWIAWFATKFFWCNYCNSRKWWTSCKSHRQMEVWRTSQLKKCHKHYVFRFHNIYFCLNMKHNVLLRNFWSLISPPEIWCFPSRVKLYQRRQYFLNGFWQNLLPEFCLKTQRILGGGPRPLHTTTFSSSYLSLSSPAASTAFSNGFFS